ncbi:MAG: MIP/aquaporin family protein [Ilumatobacteraceae bacterium]
MSDGGAVERDGREIVRLDEDVLREWPLAVRCTVELIGTFLLTLVAAGPGVINSYVGGSPIGQAAAVIAPGALVMAFIYAWGPLSGFHVNPAVTLAFAGRGVFARRWVVPYLGAQLVGCLLGAGFLQAMFGAVELGGTYPDPRAGDVRAFLMEVVLTAILVSVILHTATGYRSIGHNAALAVGATIALLGLFASPISGASMNPARSMGPAIVGADLSAWWAYVGGPIAGAAIAVVLMGALRGRPGQRERAAAEGPALPDQPP